MTKQPNSANRIHDESNPVVFCDFDGTISLEDVTDLILEELADPSWREFEAAWVQGMIGSRECLEKQMALVSASSKELNALIDAVPIDPGFAKFYEFTEKTDIPFYILSDGFDFVIRRVLRRVGADGELRNGKHLFTSSMEIDQNRLKVSFPHDPRVCEHGCATCKPAIIRRVGHGHRPVIFIGDGLSDQFALEASDLVFAKKQLLAHCRKNDIPCLPFETFTEIEITLATMFQSSNTESNNRPIRRGKNSKAAAIGTHSNISLTD